VADIDLALARRIVDAAAAHAEAIECPVSIAVLDAGRELLAFIRLDGAPLLSAEVCQSKAYTARSLDVATADLAALTQPGAPLYGLETAHPRRLAAFGGGRPIELDGAIAGAVGVAGGTVEQDDEIARAGLAAAASR
jgi:uncharacterized protein GlcG (DUF336 family)